MRRISTSILAVAFTAGILSNSLAADVKKNPPKNRRAVEEILKPLGEEYFPEHMKVTEVGSVETDTTWYHVYCGTLREGGYRIIIFDNTPKFLGFYQVQYEPTDVGEGEIELESDEATAQGGAVMKVITIPDKGPAANISLDGVPCKFIKAPKPKEEAAEGNEKAGGTAAPAKPEELGPGGLPTVGTGTETTEETPAAPEAKAVEYEYREWTISMGGKEIKVEACFVALKNNKVTIRNAKSGSTADIPVSALSAADKAYLKKILK